MQWVDVIGKKYIARVSIESFAAISTRTDFALDYHSMLEVWLKCLLGQNNEDFDEQAQQSWVPEVVVSTGSNLHIVSWIEATRSVGIAEFTDP